MGTCLSKKTTSPPPPPPRALPCPPDQTKLSTEVAKNTTEEETTKKEVLVIKHRKSHDIDRHSEEEKKGREDQKVASTTTTTTTTTATTSTTTSEAGNICNGGFSNGGSVVVRTSSCTKEEVDAILIQCGRLSRSSSSKKAGGSSDNTGNPHRGLKYSGSKRSYDFDNETAKGNGTYDDNVVDETAAGERINRQRQRQSRGSPSPSHRRRRTPSRERDQQPQQQRSGSRERGNSGGGRRVSRSPGRRNGTNGVADSTPSSANGGDSCRPGKIVSVPATVSSLAMDKSNNGGGAEPLSAAAKKRISVKRNTARSCSPARANVRASNENQDAHSNQHKQQPLSLSRSNSRKADQSPYRRNPLSEIDTNITGSEQMTLPNNNILPQAAMHKPNIENASNKKVVVQGSENKTSQKGAADKIVTVNLRGKEQQLVVEEAKGLQSMARDITVTAIASGDDSLKPQTLVRSRSSRRSRDLDLNPETLLNPNTNPNPNPNPNPTYAALLLEDIQNFHQKNTNAVSLPPCVTKACSILEAVADLNSSTSSNLSCTEERRRRSPTSEQLNKNTDNFSLGANPVGKKRIDPFVESEVVVADDLIEPSLHKYVTTRGGTVEVENMEEQESSGSNSFVSGQLHWVSSTSWEPNSADSTDCWTSSRSGSRDDRIPLSFQRHALSEPGGCNIDDAKRRLIGKKREAHQQIGLAHC
ncbi:uncharacterized protein At1g65710-like isoform X2 [Cornus florida]|uniref:uncharacterized protein At1g65710-like isoform X2 n=1 Tax=Cornus florida TaxID=4283 RepID=UPI00289FF775|nr:uncharacterized protein At1g65710-like isoform X2 [Cornus florida]